MSAVQITMIVFVTIEILSVLELYFLQEKAVFNGVSIFSGWEISKEVPEVHQLLKYLVNWVAGIKLIVIGLILVLVFTAPVHSLICAAAALVITVSSYFWRMYPMLQKHDQAGLVSPRGRSRMMGAMVLGLEVILIASMLVELLN